MRVAKVAKQSNSLGALVIHTVLSLHYQVVTEITASNRARGRDSWNLGGTRGVSQSKWGFSNTTLPYLIFLCLLLKLNGNQFIFFQMQNRNKCNSFLVSLLPAIKLLALVSKKKKPMSSLPVRRRNAGWPLKRDTAGIDQMSHQKLGEMTWLFPNSTP